MTDPDGASGSKRFKVDPESTESVESSSTPSLETLNQDCLRTLFDLLTLNEVLQLRYVSRTLNNAIGQFLRTSFRNLAILLDADRSQLELDQQARGGGFGGMFGAGGFPGAMRGLGNLLRNPAGAILPPQSDTALFQDQTHFRFADFITVKTSEISYHSKVASLALFLGRNMPDLEEFGLLIGHEKHLWSAPPILASLRKLKILLIDKSESVVSDSSMTGTMDVISGMAELEQLYYFSSRASRESFEDDYLREMVGPMQIILQPHAGGQETGQMLSNGQNFFEMMLRKVRVLHAPGMTFPFGLRLDNIEEMSIMHEEQPCVTKNHYPKLRKLIAPAGVLNYPSMGYGCSAFANLEILKLNGRSILLENKTLRALKDMPKLTELHCQAIELMGGAGYAPCTEQNQTIVRLVSKKHYLYIEQAPGPAGLFQMNHNRPRRRQQQQLDPTNEEMEEYAKQCKLSFVGLRRFEIEQPVHLVQFDN